MRKSPFVILYSDNIIMLGSEGILASMIPWITLHFGVFADSRFKDPLAGKLASDTLAFWYHIVRNRGNLFPRRKVG